MNLRLNFKGFIKSFKETWALENRIDDLPAFPSLSLEKADGQKSVQSPQVALTTSYFNFIFKFSSFSLIFSPMPSLLMIQLMLSRFENLYAPSI